MSTTSRIVHLVDFYWTRDKDPRVPLGHASLLTALLKAGIKTHSHAFAVNAMCEEGDDHTLRDFIERVMEDVSSHSAAAVDVAIGVYIWGEQRVQQCIKLLRARGFKGRIILGGPQISYSTGSLDGLYPGADVFVKGYGEQALVELARSPGHVELDGVYWAGQQPGSYTVQAQVALEELDSPWLTGHIPLHGQRFIRWETQRGCPFRCAFCQHREAGQRLPRRELEEERILKEIKLFCASDVEEIAILDPIFNLPKDRAVKVLHAFVEHGYRGRLSLQCRAEAITEEFLDAASLLDVCLEFGLQTIHEDEGRASQRKNNVERVEQTLREVRRRGLQHEVSIIFGLPHQTLTKFEQTVQWCLDLRVSVIKAFPLMLLRGTELDARRHQWGLITRSDEDPTVIRSNTFDEEDWSRMALLSDALKKTECNHPHHVQTLHAMTQHAPDLTRWRPRDLDGEALKPTL